MSEKIMMGTWELYETTDVPEEAKEALRAVERDFVGAKFTPVSCIATQAVNGINYLLIATRKILGKPEADKIVALTVNQPASGDECTIVGEIKELN